MAKSLKTTNAKQTRNNGETTRLKILDAAEALFGEAGFDAVSLREITIKAEVTLALASYHFGTKEHLFEEIIARRAKVLADARLERLEGCDQTSVTAILDAFMRPPFDMVASDEPGWRDFFKLLGRLGVDNVWLDVLSRHFDAPAQHFLDALCSAMPDVQRPQIAQAFTMMLHVMLASVGQHERIDRLTKGDLKAADVEATYKPLLRFVTAGFESVKA